MTLNDPYPGVKVTPFFDAEYLRNGTRYRHSYNFNGILIGIHTPYSAVSFQRTLSDRHTHVPLPNEPYMHVLYMHVLYDNIVKSEK